MARIGIPGRSIGPGSDDWIAAEFERRRKWEREFTAAMPTMVRGIVSDLSSTVTALGVTQGELATAQGTLATVVSDLPLPVVVSDSRTGYSMPVASFGNLRTTAVAIPTGYTRADFTILAAISAENNSASTSLMLAGITCNGIMSPSSFDNETPSGDRASVVRVVSGSLTGLAAGSLTVSVDGYVLAPWLSTTNSVYISGTVIFRK